MTLLARLLALLSLAVLLPATAAQAVFTERVGDQTLTLPIPDGFDDPSAAPQLYRDLMAKGMPASNRFLALIVPHDFHAAQHPGEKGSELARYFIVNTFPAYEASGVSDEFFEQAKTSIRRRGAQIMADAEASVASNVERMSKQAGQALGDRSIAVKVGASASLGVFDERPESIAYAAVGPVTASSDNGSVTISQVRVIALVRVRGRPLSFLAYSRDDSPADVEWVEAQARDWITRTLELNPATPSN